MAAAVRRQSERREGSQEGPASRYGGRAPARAPRPRLARLGLAALAFLGAAGAATAQQGVEGCQYGLYSYGSSYPVGGGDGMTRVWTNLPECPWTAVSNDPSWVTITAGASGTGITTVEFTVSPNGGPGRSTTLSIAGYLYSVRQDGVVCSYSLAASTFAAGAAAGTGSAGLTTNGFACPWSAASNTPWLTITSPASGAGSATVEFSYEANVGEVRSGTLTIAGLTFTVNQAAAPCTFALDAASAAVPAAGGSGQVAVTTNLASCGRTAVSSAPAWLTVTSGASGTGSGTVGWAATANAGEVRSATLTIGDQVFTVNQAAAPCTFALDGSSAAAPAAGGSGQVAVSANLASCAWTAESSEPAWLTVASGASGSGNGTVGWAAAANEGEARSAALTIAGLTFTVNQAAAPCTFALDAASAAVPAAGGSGQVAVTTNLASCGWTAVTSAPAWLTVASGASGTGSGTVGWAATANAGEARSATLTIGDQVFTANQDVAPCSFTVDPLHFSVQAAGGARTVAVTANVAACPWTAASNDPDWLSVTAGASGEGSGTVTVTVAPGSGEARSGTLEVAGQLVAVTQVADAFALMIPAAANTDGVGNSRWLTDLDLLNIGDADAVVELSLLRANQANPTPSTKQVTVPAGGTSRVANVLGTVFSAGNAALGITFVSGSADVNARFYNTASACGGTYGMMLPASQASAAVFDGAPVYFHLLTHSADPAVGFRVNVGFANATGTATDMAVELHSGNGTLLKTVSQALEGYEHRQITTIFRQPPATPNVAAGYAVVRAMTQGGMVYTYAMTIDNVSGDPIYIRPVRGTPAPVAGGFDIAIAAAANTPGENGTQWESDVDLFNSGAAPASVELSLLRANQANPTPATAEITVAPGSTTRVADVLGSTFSAGNAALGVKMLSGWADVSSRFYNTASACGGTYGMFIPGESDAVAVAAGQTGYFHHLTFSRDGTKGFRVNIGFMNDTALATDVEIRLYGDNGELLKTVPATLQPYEHRQFTRIHREPPPVTNDVAHGSATVTVATAGGRVHTYAMLIDNVSGDPVFIEPTVVGTPTPAARLRLVTPERAR